jgi:hypothetical protein
MILIDIDIDMGGELQEKKNIYSRHLQNELLYIQEIPVR